MVAVAFQPMPTVAPQAKLPFVKDDGTVSEVGKQFLTQLYNQFVSVNRIIPCSCTNVSNLYTLTMFGSQPVYTGYAAFDIFGMVASATSTGLVTANVVTSSGTLKTLKVFKTNGSVQATTSDVTINLQYFLTFVDTLDSNNGGFVLR